MSGGVESCVLRGRCWREKGAEEHAHVAQCETQGRVWALKQQPLCDLNIGCNDTGRHSVERQLRVRVHEKSPQKTTSHIGHQQECLFFRASEVNHSGTEQMATHMKLTC